MHAVGYTGTRSSKLKEPHQKQTTTISALEFCHQKMLLDMRKHSTHIPTEMWLRSTFVELRVTRER